MEKNHLPARPGYKLYQDKAVYAATFIGGPLAAGYIAAENYKRLGKTWESTMAWVISVFATLIIISWSFLIPGLDKIPGTILPVAYTAFAAFLMRKFQGSKIQEHINNGGPVFTLGRAALVGLAALAVTFLLTVFILLLADPA
jgi:hypothetical protein